MQRFPMVARSAASEKHSHIVRERDLFTGYADISVDQFVRYGRMERVEKAVQGCGGSVAGLHLNRHDRSILFDEKLQFH